MLVQNNTDDDEEEDGEKLQGHNKYVVSIFHAVESLSRELLGTIVWVPYIIPFPCTFW